MIQKNRSTIEMEWSNQMQWYIFFFKFTCKFYFVEETLLVGYVVLHKKWWYLCSTLKSKDFGASEIIANRKWNKLVD